MQIRAAFASTARCSPRQMPAAIKPSAKSKSHRRKSTPPFPDCIFIVAQKFLFVHPRKETKKFLHLLAGKSNFAKN
jgi:hypothetical protein